MVLLPTIHRSNTVGARGHLPSYGMASKPKPYSYGRYDTSVPTPRNGSSEPARIVRVWRKGFGVQIANTAKPLLYYCGTTLLVRVVVVL